MDGQIWFDLILAAIWAGVTYAVASQGMWGAAVMLLNVLFGGLIAMNFWEPAAHLLRGIHEPWDYWYDIIAIMVIFTGAVFALRSLTDQISPLWVQFPAALDQAGRWFFAGWTGWLTIAFLSTAVHTAPLPREFIGFSPEKESFFGLPRPDRVWLAYTQRTSEVLLERSTSGQYAFDRTPMTPAGVAHSFLPRYATRRQAAAAGGPAAAPQGGPQPPGAGPPVF